MADNAYKIPLAVSLDRLSRERSNDATQLLGKELPCHVTKVTGQIVTVSFDVKSPFTLQQVEMPIDTSINDWIPVQVGDKGIARTADVYLGGVSGLGTGVADLSRRAPLTMLVFHPTSNVAWTPPGGDAFKNYRIIQGPDGVRIQDKAGQSVVTINASGVTVVTQGTASVTSQGAVSVTSQGAATVNAQGAVTVQSAGEVTIKGTKIHMVPPP